MTPDGAAYPDVHADQRGGRRRGAGRTAVTNCDSSSRGVRLRRTSASWITGPSRRATGPYKTFIGAVAERADGVGAFVRISSRGVLVGTGMPMMAPDQLATFRAAVSSEAGAALARAIETVRGRGVTVHGGRWEPLVATPPWANPSDAAVDLRDAMASAVEVDRWLGRHVGSSAMTPEERFARR